METSFFVQFYRNFLFTEKLKIYKKNNEMFKDTKTKPFRCFKTEIRSTNRSKAYQNGNLWSSKNCCFGEEEWASNFRFSYSRNSSLHLQK